MYSFLYFLTPFVVYYFTIVHTWLANSNIYKFCLVEFNPFSASIIDRRFSVALTAVLSRGAALN